MKYKETRINNFSKTKWVLYLEKVLQDLADIFVYSVRFVILEPL